LCVAAFGPQAALPAALATTLLAVFDLSAAILLLELDRNTSTGASGWRIVKNIAASLARNPLMIGVMAGLAVALTAGELPVALTRFCELVGGAAIPCSLVALGLFFATQPFIQEWVELSVLSVIKLLIHPAVAYALVTTVFTMEPQLAVITVLLASLPPATTVFVVAQRYKVHMRQTSALMLVTTLLSVLTAYAILRWMPA
jgi:malonate transporter